MSVFVVDASVAIKWFIPEVHSDAARRLLDHPHQYFAPDLLFAEVGNIVWKKVRRHEIAAQDAGRLVEDLSRSVIEAVPCRTLLTDAHALAAATGQTVYDSMYVALAIRLDTRLITADAKLWGALAGFPLLARHVELLAAFSG